MVTFTCPKCGQGRTALRRRCYPCTVSQSPASRERIRQSLKGVRHDEKRRLANSEGQKGRTDNRRFDLAALTRGKPSHNAKPLGAEYANKEGRVFIKVSERGKYWRQMWKRRAHMVWKAANGPVPRGRLLHHINGDCADDRLDNLQLVTRAEHARLHATPERQRAAQLLGVAARKRNGNY